mmetsp:Transcript_16656/g.38276  ORF Transcript_16656/g.38276 Transcript_16656/m.38276 type:complete len:263 (+) Transcript_16656:45-833(+)
MQCFCWFPFSFERRRRFILIHDVQTDDASSGNHHSLSIPCFVSWFAMPGFRSGFANFFFLVTTRQAPRKHHSFRLSTETTTTHTTPIQSNPIQSIQQTEPNKSRHIPALEVVVPVHRRSILAGRSGIVVRLISRVYIRFHRARPPPPPRAVAMESSALIQLKKARFPRFSSSTLLADPRPDLAPRLAASPFFSGMSKKPLKSMMRLKSKVSLVRPDFASVQSKSPSNLTSSKSPTAIPFWMTHSAGSLLLLLSKDWVALRGK